jgi:hypothetical protein
MRTGTNFVYNKEDDIQEVRFAARSAREGALELMAQPNSKWRLRAGKDEVVAIGGTRPLTEER